MRDTQQSDPHPFGLTETEAPFSGDELATFAAQTLRPDISLQKTDVAAADLVIDEGEGANLRPRHEYQEGLDIEATLGEGGMGIVRLATQKSVGRKVAVKTLRPEKKTEQRELRLLREAWVTGYLEHPNIPPLYDITLDAAGLPQVVLKRIDGDQWGERMHRGRVGTTLPDELLAWNIEILEQVCDALRFAHSHNIIHRDVKPENVMVGEFGEVYLLDWGIAACLAPDAPRRLPKLDDPYRPAGTPCYMAPEMLHGKGVSFRTDIYLLGAVLYEILTGRPPHMGRSFDELVQSIRNSPPPMPPNIPPELAWICSKAMAKNPNERFRDVDAFRHVLGEYRERRTSRELADEGHQLRTRLAQQIEANQEDLEIYATFNQARFAYGQALRTWPENRLAKECLHNLIKQLATYEVDRGRLDAAKALTAELGDPPRDLLKRIELLEREERERINSLEQVKRRFALETDSRFRALMTAGFGLTWSIIPLGFVAFLQGSRFETCAWFTGCFGFLFTALSLPMLAKSARDRMIGAQANRQSYVATMVSLAAAMVSSAVGWQLDMSPAQIIPFWYISWGTITALVASWFGLILLPSALGYLVAAIVTTRFPEGRYYIMACANLVPALSSLAAVWWETRQQGADKQQNAQKP